MGVILREREPEGSKGVTLDQLARLVERAQRETGPDVLHRGQVTPKARINFGGTIKQIEIEIG